MVTAPVIIYALEPNLAVAEFQSVLVASTLGERRPVDDLPRLDAMLRGAQIIVTARDGAKLVGVSRALSDFSYCCYLSDLAVDTAYQQQGIGKQLIAATHAAAGEQTTLILLAAPAAIDYYPKIGMQHAPQCWITPRQR
jgi:ribosomal protein S18 acetylase RimI-like enzyme